MNPQCPRLYGQPKVHKTDIPVRPVVSYNTAPAYKLAKYGNKIIKNILHFKPKYGIKNSLQLIDLIKDLKMPNNATLVSFDVVSLFTNIPTNELKIIINKYMEKININFTKRHEINTLLNTCIEQNYFRFNNNFYSQSSGLAMGSPISPILAEFFMDYMEESIEKLKSFKNVFFYRRYVDDILIIWTGTNRQLHMFLEEINKINKSIQFTMEKGGNQINFLDIGIEITNNKLDFSIYRKPTYSDNIIHNTSRHHISHKLSVFHSLIHRLLHVPLNCINFNNELNVIKTIAKNNGYSSGTITNLLRKKDKKLTLTLISQGLTNINDNEPTKQWAKIPYIGELSTKISRITNDDKRRTAFYNVNSLGKILINNKDRREKLENSGVYQVTCSNCPSYYIGQTGRSVKIRVKEHFTNWVNNKGELSNVAAHLLDNQHSFHKDSDVKILHTCIKGQKLDRLESIEITRLTKKVDPKFVMNKQLESLVKSPLLYPL